MATCPECEFDEIDTEDFEAGDTINCPECGKNLVVVGPDELDFADEDEDEEDDLEEEDLEEDEDEDELGEDEDEEEEEDYNE
jgi:alpha-aminoadipate carrier protein LysW